MVRMPHPRLGAAVLVLLLLASCSGPASKKALEEESFTSALAPLPLDPEEQRLLTIYDQQTEQEQYEQAVAEWRRSEAKRRLVWQEALQQRQEAAVTERDQLADQLRTIHPALLTAAKPPSLDAKELERFLACSVERQR